MADPVADLIAKLQHRRKSVREGALIGLVHRTLDPAVVLPALRAVLTDPDEDRSLCSRASGLIAGLGPAGMPTLLEVARTGEAEIRTECMQRLAFAFPTSDQKHAILWTLIDGLGDADEFVRSRAVEDLRGIGPAAVELLQRAVEGEDVAGSYAAIALLMLDRDQRGAVERLVATLDHADAVIRRAAAQGLEQATAHAPLAWRSLLARLEDTDSEVRRAAAMALAKLPRAPADEAIPILIRALREIRGEYTDWHFRACVGYVLRLYGDEATPAVPAIVETLVELLEDFDFLDGPDGYASGSLTRALGDIGPTAAPALPLLRQLGKRARAREDDDLAEEVRETVRQIRGPTRRKT
jgi:HEAT repeat protein